MSLELPIYMDYNATTPCDKRVVAAMEPYWTEHFGNAASRSHSFGWKAEEAVETARKQVAKIIGAQAKEIIFTSGATESDNLAIKGVAEFLENKGKHIITCLTEHKAVIDPFKYLEKKGYDVTWLKPDEYGIITPEQVEEAITDQTVLVSIMLANNETGVINPCTAIGKICREKGVLFHTDATQAIGKMPVNVDEMNIDLLSMSAHKLYGPKGVGALYVRSKNPNVKLTCQMHGGGHQRRMRSGTLNVTGIVGFGKACEIAMLEMPEEIVRLRKLRDRLEQGMLKNIPYIIRSGHAAKRLPNTTNLAFAYVEGEGMMMKCSNIAVSAGSACTSESLSASHVLTAMGVSDALSHSAMRFSLGRFSTEAEVDYAIEVFIKAVRELRDVSPLVDMAKASGEIETTQWAKPKE